MESAVSPSENEWHLKGVRQGGNEILNCVFTFTNECDKEQMKELFENIVYIAK
jgi:hypothetical protein